jgi:hypothetical protein
MDGVANPVPQPNFDLKRDGRGFKPRPATERDGRGCKARPATSRNGHLRFQISNLECSTS